MSKKKPSGKTITLKDFHGGSIPTDLPLPSAPGIVPRTADRPGYVSIGNPLGRSDHRARPNSSPSMRQFDEKTPFLTHAAHIGRNFDEDERKPLDGHSAPRKMVSDDSLRLPNSHRDVKVEPVSSVRVTGSHEFTPFSAHLGNSTQMLGSKSENMVSSSSHNAWGMRKEMSAVGKEPVQPAWSGQTVVSKLVHASAVDKVTSGRWQSKVSLPNQTDIEVIMHPEPEIVRLNNYDQMLVRGRESSDLILARHVERGLSIEEGTPGWRKGPADYKKSDGMAALEVKEAIKPATNSDKFQTVHSVGKFPDPEMKPMASSKVSDRPKLNLQPRRKALENTERLANDLQQEHQSGTSIIGHPGASGVFHSTKPGLASGESVNQPVERPKLNLKPRSQPLEQSVGKFERERGAVFGGARPRELVLKERGTDDIKSQEPVQHSNRIIPSVQKTERVPSRQGERPENMSRDMKTTRKPEKKDNWRDNENKRNNNRDIERQQDRHPSPETWRKPVEPPKPASPDGSGLRFGKVASAVELAQAFSKPFSGPKEDDRLATQRGGVSGRAQVPFSRLMSPTPRQIDGY